MLAIRGGILHTITQGVIENGTLLIGDDGRIQEVGRSVQVPEGTPQIDAAGNLVFPGFIDAHNHSGAVEEGVGTVGEDENEMTDPITPQLRIIDAINPEDQGLRDAVEGGVTTVWITPGSGNVIGGQGATVHTHGRTVEEMLLKGFSGMKAAFGENPKRVYGGQKKMPSTRMGSVYLLREALTKAQGYLDKKERFADDPEKAPETDLKMEALGQVLRREVPLRCHSHRADDIRSAVRIGDEFGIRIVIDHGMEAHKVADLLAERGIPVACGPGITTRVKVELRDKTTATPALLAAAGVKVAIMTDHPVIPVESIVLCAGLAVAAGLDEEEAFRALTVTPAEITGVADQTGSLEPGKLADIAIWDGHPFDARSHVLYTLINGQVVYSRD